VKFALLTSKQYVSIKGDGKGTKLIEIHRQVIRGVAKTMSLAKNQGGARGSE